MNLHDVMARAMAAAECRDVPSFARFLGQRTKTIHAWQQAGRKPQLPVILERLQQKVPGVNLHAILCGDPGDTVRRLEAEVVSVREQLLRLDGQVSLLKEQLREAHEELRGRQV